MSSTPPLKFMGRISLLIYATLAALAAGTITPILPKISDEFYDGANGVYIKMVVTALGLGILFGSLIGGFLADRFGRKAVMLGSTFLYAIAGCSIFFTATLWPVIIARCFVGMAVGALGTAVIAVIGDYFGERDRSRWLGYIASAGTATVLPMYPIVGYIADSGWRNSFLIYGVSLLGFACIMVGIPSSARASDATAAAAQRMATKARFYFPWSVFFVSVAIGVIATCTALYVPFRFREVGLRSAGQISIYLLPSVFTGGVMAFFYGYFRRFTSVETVFLVAALASCVGLVIAAYALNPVMVTAGMMIESFAVGVLIPNVNMFALNRSSAEHRARTVGVAKGALFGSPFVAQFFLEWVSQRGGASLALLSIAAVGALIAIAFALRRLGSGNSPGDIQLSPES